MAWTPSSPFDAEDSSPDPSVSAADASFAVRVRHPRPGVLVVSAVGEVDVLTVRTLTDVLSIDLPATTVLDLSDVTLLSAAALRVLHDAADRAVKEHRRLRVVAVNSCVLHLLRLAELDLRVPVYPSVREALNG